MNVCNQDGVVPNVPSVWAELRRSEIVVSFVVLLSLGREWHGSQIYVLDPCVGTFSASEHSAATGNSDFSGVGQLYDGASSGLEDHDDLDDADHGGNSDQESEPAQVEEEEEAESGGASDLEPLGPIRVPARGEAIWHSMC